MNAEYPPRRWITRVWERESFPAYQQTALTIAHHEAGHAVVCMFFGIPIQAARFDTETLSGAVELDRAGMKEERERLSSLSKKPCDETKTVQQAALWASAMYFAGMEAEFIFHGITHKGPVFVGTSDQQAALEILRDAYGHTTPVYYCQRLARAILLENWRSVSAIAESLHENGYMNIEAIKSAAHRGNHG